MRLFEGTGNKYKDLLIFIAIDIIFLFGCIFIVNYLDLMYVNYHWIELIKEKGLFHIYDSFIEPVPRSVDYPPLYLYWLWLIRNLISETNIYQNMFMLKLFPFLMNVITQIFLYKKYSAKAAYAWTFNIAIIINVVWWGQLDGVFGFMIILLLYLFSEKKLYEPCVLFALMCLFKPQGLYFIFPLGIYIVTYKIEWIKKVIAILIGMVVGYMGYLPFIFISGNWMLPFEHFRYIGLNNMSFGNNVGNMFGLFESCEFSEKYHFVSVVLVLICMFISFYIFCKTNDLIYTTTLYLFIIYLFTLYQHERYIIYTIVMLFYMIYLQELKEYTDSYLYLTVSAIIIQIGLLLYMYLYRYYCMIYDVPILDELPDSIVFVLVSIRYCSVICSLVLNYYVFNKIVLMRFSNFLVQKEKPFKII